MITYVPFDFVPKWLVESFSKGVRVDDKISLRVEYLEGRFGFGEVNVVSADLNVVRLSDLLISSTYL